MRARFLLIAVVLTLAPFSARAGLVVGTFEDVNPGVDTYQNDPGSTFMTNGFTLNNSYDPTYGDWSGFAVSSMVDNQFGGADYNHEYGAYAPLGANGTGSGGSATYGIAFNYNLGDAIINMPTGVSPVSIDITNTTYTAQAIVEGDGFATAFSPGSYFKLDIIGYSGLNGSGSVVGDVPFYLANYPVGGTLQLVSNWTTVDLTSLAGAKPGIQPDLDRRRRIRHQHPDILRDRQHHRATAVPEPSTVLLFSIGLAGVSVAHRRGRAAEGTRA